MDENELRAFVENLDDFQLVQLSGYVAEFLSIRGLTTFNSFGTHTHDQHSPNAIDPSFTSTSPTLLQSGRTSTQSNSIHSGDTLSLHSRTLPERQNLFFPGLGSDGQQTDRSAGASTAVDSSLDVAQRKEASQGINTVTPPVSGKGTTCGGEAVCHTKRLFFCTYCCELDIWKTFKTKHDWKRHENEFHETEFEWHCPSPNCEEIFARERDFKHHNEKVHGSRPSPRANKLVPPKKVVYACGFEGCRKLTFNWKDRCDHVARCMQGDAAKWSYTWKLRNLLRQTDVSQTWKRVRSLWCNQLNINPSVLSWDPKTSRCLRQQLESRSFEPSLDSILLRLFKLGHPDYSVSHNFRSQFIQLAAFPQTLDPSFEFQTPPAVFGPPAQHGQQLTYDQQRHPRNPASTISNEYTINDQKRNSVTMLDAPPASSSVANLNPTDDHLMTLQEMIYSQPYNGTPPVSDTSFDTSTAPAQDVVKVSPRRKLMSRSKELLSHKKSQQFHQPIVTNHPDLSLNYRVPSSSSTKPTTVGQVNFGTNNIYNNYPEML